MTSPAAPGEARRAQRGGPSERQRPSAGGAPGSARAVPIGHAGRAAVSAGPAPVTGGADPDRTLGGADRQAARRGATRVRCPAGTPQGAAADVATERPGGGPGRSERQTWEAGRKAGFCLKIVGRRFATRRAGRVEVTAIGTARRLRPPRRVPPRTQRQSTKERHSVSLPRGAQHCRTCVLRLHQHPQPAAHPQRPAVHPAPSPGVSCHRQIITIRLHRSHPRPPARQLALTAAVPLASSTRQRQPRCLQHLAT